MNIDSMLRQWGNAIHREMEMTGFSKKTITCKLMECGVMVDSGVIPTPGYWPNSDVLQINNLIWALPVQERNIIVGKRVLKYSYKEIGESVGLSKWGVMKKMDKIEQKLSLSLQKSPL